MRRLILTLATLAIAEGTIAVLPHALSPSGAPLRAVLADIAPSLCILAIWIVLSAKSSRSENALWALPSDLFRLAILVGGASVFAFRAASLALAYGASTRTLIVTGIEDLLYGLGVVALGALAAFALARTMLRPVVGGHEAPASARDITLRTRFLVASSGASFATAGVLLDVLVDFERTSNAALAGYVLTAFALVGLCAAIGWLVGDDTARGIESVSARLRDLAGRESALSAAPLLAADEIGDLAAAATEIERRFRREETAAAAAAERERIARELHDSAAKSVSVLGLEVAAIASRAPAVLQPELARVEHLSRLLSEELRAIVTEVRSKDVGEPFANSVRRAADRYPGTRLEVSGDLDRIGTLARFEILRIVQEGLRNAKLHSGATEIVTRVALRDGRVRVEIEDDGRGIEQVPLEGLVEQGHFGLIGLRERAGLLRGSLTVEPRLEGGTRVRVDFPLALT